MQGQVQATTVDLPKAKTRRSKSNTSLKKRDEKARLGVYYLIVKTSSSWRHRLERCYHNCQIIPRSSKDMGKTFTGTVSKVASSALIILLEDTTSLRMSPEFQTLKGCTQVYLKYLPIRNKATRFIWERRKRISDIITQKQVLCK